MLFTAVHPDRARGAGLHATDVEVDDGLPLPALLSHLARFTGWTGWPTAPVAVGGTTLTPAHLTGQFPLVAGCTLRPVAEPAQDVGGRAAVELRAPWHVAVVAGPDCGAVVGTGPGTGAGTRGSERRLVAVPSAATDSARTGADVPIGDPSWAGLTLHVRAYRRRGRTRFTVRLTGTGVAARTARLVRPGRRRSVRLRVPLRCSWLARATATLGLTPTVTRLDGSPGRPIWRPSARRWRPGQVLRVGATTLELRRSPAEDVPRTGDGSERRGVGTHDVPPAQRGVRRPSRAELLTWTAPAAGSVALAIALRQPTLLLAALVGPVAAFASRAAQERSTTQDATASVVDPPGLVADTVRALWATGVHGGRDDAAAGRSSSIAPTRGGVGRAGGHLGLAGSTLAVVGPAELAQAAARAVLLRAVGTDGALAVAVHTGAGGAWSWTRWLSSGRRLPTSADAETLVVADLTGGAAPGATPARTVEELAAWRARVPSRHRLLLVLPADGPAGRAAPLPTTPAWCRTTLTVDAAGARLRIPDGRHTAVPLHAVTVPSAEEQARRVAALRHVAPRTGAHADAEGGTPGTSMSGDEPPPVADLGSLPGMPEPTGEAVRAAWSRSGTGLPVQLGVGPGGAPVAVDLVRDGPHLLVAGTTGAGKSQLLAALVLGLALTQPPERLAVTVVDFKGGTSLGAVADLPHVVGRVDDLDAAHTSRALTGLRAELHRRERIVAAAGVRDVADLDPADPTTPARLLVVVDEFRALADELPDALPALARLAAQGRSLGMHLVLATQRPAGAVTPDLRANISLRACLRVTDAAESQDVLDSPAAAAISPDRPGRAWLRRGSAPVEPVQIARTRTGGTTAAVRPAPPWCDPALVPSEPVTTAAQRPGGAPRMPSGDDLDARSWVRAVQQAAEGRTLPASPWLPELPSTVGVDQARQATPGHPGQASGPGSTLTIGLADRPDEQRRTHLGWDPTHGHLLVLGGPRSGRTTALLALGVQAAESGWTVHAIGLPADALDVLARTGGLGTCVGTDDPRRSARLLELLGAHRHGTRHLLLVDGVEAALASLAPLARGAAADRLTALWSEGPRQVTVLASAAVTPGTVALASSFRDRLVLPVTDPGLDLVAGVPAELRGTRRVAGRAVHLGPSGAVLCQVARIASAPGAEPWSHADSAPRGRTSATAGTCGRRSPSLSPLPARITLPGPPLASPAPAAPPPPEAAAGTVPSAHPSPSDDVPPGVAAEGVRRAGSAARAALGVGGDDARELSVDLSRGLLVTGPAGSGRSSALASVVVQLRRQGLPVLRLGSAGAPLEAVIARGTLADLDDLPRTGRRPQAAPSPVPTAAPAASRALPRPLPLSSPFVVVDDLDELEVTYPQSADLLAEAVVRGEVHLLASVLTDRAASAFRGAVAHAVRTAVLLVLEPAAAGSADLLGPRASWVVDPSGPVGRAAVREGRRVEPLQVYLPG